MHGPPGRLIAIGVISIILGFIGVFLAIVSMLGVVVLFDRAQAYIPNSGTITGQTSVAPVTPAPPKRIVSGGGSGYRGEPDMLQGFRRADREMILQVVASRIQLRPQRREMLRRLLGECGHEIFPNIPTPTAQAISSGIVESGQLPAGPDGPGALGTQYVKTVEGFVLLDDEDARFIAAKGRHKVEVADDVVKQDSSDWTGPCVVCIEEQLEELRGRLGGQVTAEQASALASWVQMHGALDSMSKVKQHTPRLVDLVQSTGDGELWIKSAGIWITPTGAESKSPPGTARMSPPSTPVIPPPVTPTWAQPTPGARPIPITPGLAWYSLIETTVGLILAVLLVISGILLCARSRSGARWHAQWAWLKIAFVVCTAWPSMLLSQSAMYDYNMTTVAHQVGWMFGTVIALAIQLGYPLIVLAVLATPVVRIYYAGLADTSLAFEEQTRSRLALKLTGMFGGWIGKSLLALLTLALIACTLQFLWNADNDPFAWYAQRVVYPMLGMFGFVAAGICVAAALGFRKQTASQRAAAIAAVAALCALTSLAHAAPASNPSVTRERMTSLIEEASDPRPTHSRIASRDIQQLVKVGDQTLFDMLLDQDEQVRQTALDGFRFVTDIPFSRKLTQAIPWLTEQLANSNAVRRATAMKLLGNTGNDGGNAMYNLFDSPNRDLQAVALQYAARHALVERNKQRQAFLHEHLPLIVSFLSDPDRIRRGSAMTALYVIGTFDEFGSAIDDLVRKDSDSLPQVISFLTAVNVPPRDKPRFDQSLCLAAGRADAGNRSAIAVYYMRDVDINNGNRLVAQSNAQDPQVREGALRVMQEIATNLQTSGKKIPQALEDAVIEAPPTTGPSQTADPLLHAPPEQLRRLVELAVVHASPQARERLKQLADAELNSTDPQPWRARSTAYPVDYESFWSTPPAPWKSTQGSRPSLTAAANSSPTPPPSAPSRPSEPPTFSAYFVAFVGTGICGLSVLMVALRPPRFDPKLALRHMR